MPIGKCSMKSQRAAAAAASTSASEAPRPAVADVLHDRAMEQRDVLRHHRDRGAQALLRDARDVLPVDQDAALLHVVEALQEGRTASTCRRPRDRPSRRAARLQCAASDSRRPAVRPDAERDLVELDAGAEPHQRRGLGMVAQVMRHQQASTALPTAGPDAGSRRPAPPPGRASHAGPTVPSVHARTTSPVVISPRCQSTIAQASRPIVSTTVTSAWMMRSRSR